MLDAAKKIMTTRVTKNYSTEVISTVSSAFISMIVLKLGF